MDMHNLADMKYSSANHLNCIALDGKVRVVAEEIQHILVNTDTI